MRRTRHWTLCVKFTVQLSPVASAKTEPLPHSSSTIHSNTDSHSRSRCSSSLRPSFHHCTIPKLIPSPTSHLRLTFIPSPSCQPCLWFKLFWNRRLIRNLHRYPSLSSRTSSRGQRDLWTPSQRKRRPAKIPRDPADLQPVPTENPTRRETQRVRPIWRHRRVEKKGRRPWVNGSWRKSCKGFRRWW